jgi:coenzyme F420-0:L-glutamate ligase / coenzyme F420-1:gamma-L-glutamate ligase
MQELGVIPVPLSGDVRPGDSLVDKFLDALKRRRVSLAKGDILVVKHKIVSKAEGQLIQLNTIKASARSRA